jgi:flagellar hook assembly protein FlgD
VEPVEATEVAGAGSLPFTLAQNQPNPFVAGRGATAIAFDLRDGAHAKLRVFDLSGRLVRVLMDAAIGAGPHTVSWDGRTDAGREAASGSYYYRLEVGERSESRALVKLR